MSIRKEPFFQDGLFHIFNKTIDDKKIFLNESLCDKFLDIVRFYKTDEGERIKYSRFVKKDHQDKILSLTMADQLLEIFAFCLMPNHFHFLIKQKTEMSISKCMVRILDSFSKYFNILNNRKGPIFLTSFKSISIKSKEQMLHVSRYIHLNPISSGVVQSIDELRKYPFSSYFYYINGIQDTLLDSDFMRDYYRIDTSINIFLTSTENNVEWQKTLEKIKRAE